MDIYRPFRLSIIGRKQSDDGLHLCFIVQGSRIDYQWRANIVFENFVICYQKLNSDLVYLPELPVTEIYSYELSHLESIQRLLNKLFEEIGNRPDIMSHPLIEEFFSVPQEARVVSSTPSLTHNFQASDKFSVSGIACIPKEKLILASLEDASYLPQLGKLWSLIEPQELGEIMFIGRDSDLYIINGQQSKENVTCCFWHEQSSEAVFGFESGSIALCSTNRILTPNSQGTFDNEKLNFGEIKLSKLHGAKVVCIRAIDNLIISISVDNFLKVSQSINGHLEPVGGGSLRQRLGDARLISLAVDQKSKKIFLGTSINRILIYVLPSPSPKYLESITTKNDGPISCIDVRWGNIFVGDGNELIIYPNCPNTKQSAIFQLPEENGKVVKSRYLVDQEKIIVGFSNGNIIIWHSISGRILSAFKACDSEITDLDIDEEENILVVSSKLGEIRVFNL
ncbi:unnamed protein product [Blepharisma stoltei]|uniref:Uncharacterized protein n=1 Tax=Blepharisma stoltei TaxID=1481888 RepID=A0AAU9JHW8_9CILI|nr:unnamed protein product [Blepharisma stoltei]